jgi:methionyl-tRNA synthetase
VLSFVRGGLKDLSVSRTSFTWGVPIPGDPAHIMYVWLDALINYLSAVGYPDENSSDYNLFWPVAHHIVGKDILRFHAVYWPAFLMAAGLEPPKGVFAHGWWTIEGQKMSKSLGNVIDPIGLIASYGLDPVRHFLMREVPFGNDGDFSRRALINRINSDLANNLGNLVQRVLSQVQKNCDSILPAIIDPTQDDERLLAAAHGLLPEARRAIGAYELHLMLAAVFEVVDAANKYVDVQAPWALKKTDQQRMATVLAVLVEVIRHVAILLQPVIPGSAGRILDQLGVSEDSRRFCALTSGALRAGTRLPPPQGVFPRIEVDKSPS